MHDVEEFNVDGITYTLDFAAFAPACSVFFPCVATTKLRHKIQRQLTRRSMKGAFRVGMQNGRWGLAIKRTK